MARFTCGAHETGDVRPVEFTQVVEVVKGRSVVSLADWGENRFELGLSGKLMLRILDSPEGIEVNCVSTQNPNEPFASVVALGEMSEAVPIRQLEAKLRGL